MTASLVLHTESPRCARCLFVTDRELRCRRRLGDMLMIAGASVVTLAVNGAARTSASSRPNSPETALSTAHRGSMNRDAGGRVLGGRWQEAGGQGAAVCGAGAPIGGGSPRPLGGHESQLGRERRLLPASPESTSSSFSRARARGTGASSCHTASSAPFAPRRHLSALASLPSSKLFLAIR